MLLLLRILASFRAGQIDLAGVLARVRTLAADPKIDVAALIDALHADNRRVPLPTPVFAAVLRQLQTSSGNAVGT